MDLIIEIVPNEMKQVSRPDYCPLGTKVEKTKKTKKQILHISLISTSFHPFLQSSQKRRTAG